MLVRFGPFRYVFNHGFHVKQAPVYAGHMHLIRYRTKSACRKHAHDSFLEKADMIIMMASLELSQYQCDYTRNEDELN